MQYEILAKPAATVVKIKMNAGEHMTCEVGAMVAMSTRMTVETTTQKKGSSGGGIMKGLKRLFAERVCSSITLQLEKMVSISSWGQR